MTPEPCVITLPLLVVSSLTFAYFATCCTDLCFSWETPLRFFYVTRITFHFPRFFLSSSSKFHSIFEYDAARLLFFGKIWVPERTLFGPLKEDPRRFFPLYILGPYTRQPLFLWSQVSYGFFLSSGLFWLRHKRPFVLS